VYRKGQENVVVWLDVLGIDTDLLFLVVIASLLQLDSYFLLCS